MRAAYRTTQVIFTILTDRSTPLELRRMTRSEPMVFMRVRLDDGPFEERPVQLQVAWGTSATFGYDERNYTTTEPPGVRETKQGATTLRWASPYFHTAYFARIYPAAAGGEAYFFVSKKVLTGCTNRPEVVATYTVSCNC